MKSYFAFITFIAFVLHGKIVCCQPIQQPADNKISGIHSQVREKIYIHTDKEFYLAGETIWFKVYCVDEDFMPTRVSTIAYVELLDANRNAVVQAKIQLSNGMDHGSFRLPLNLPNGNFILRGYTNVMLNVSTQNYFEKKITIINTIKKFEPLKSPQAGFQFDFFPGGGRLIAGLENEVAFKLTDAFGKGIDCNGVVLKGTDTVSRFSSLQFGMGHFMLLPEKSVRYTALIYMPDGDSFTYNLPSVVEKGYVMHINKIDNHHLRLFVKTSENEESFQKVNLLISNRRQIKLIKEFTLSEGTVSSVIDVSELGDGMLELTLFNSSGKIVCEALKFIFPEYHPDIYFKTDQAVFNSRTKVNVSVRPPDTSHFTKTKMSVSVHLFDSLDQDKNESIVAALWFGGYLHGTIESPEYYFNSPDADEAVDNLLMTQGHATINTSNIEESSIKLAPEMHGHFITALVTDERTGQPGKDKLAFLSIPGKHFGFYTAESDSNGIATFEIRNAEGPSEMIFQTQLMDSNYKIRLLNQYLENESKEKSEPVSLSLNEADLLKRSIAVQAQLIYSGNVEKFVTSTNSDTLPFFGKPQVTYNLDDYTRFTTMEEVLREYVREVNVTIHDGKPTLRMYNTELNSFFSEGILVMIDGVPLGDPNKIFSVDPLIIKKLDIISRSYILGPAVFPGILSFTTAEGSAPGLKDLYPSLVRMNYEGTQLTREFFSPSYESINATGSRIPDFRSTIYWNPFLAINNNTASFSFYTSDMKGKFLVKVEGIDDHGYPFEQSAIITVK